MSRKERRAAVAGTMATPNDIQPMQFYSTTRSRSTQKGWFCNLARREILGARLLDWFCLATDPQTTPAERDLAWQFLEADVRGYYGQQGVQHEK